MSHDSIFWNNAKTIRIPSFLILIAAFTSLSWCVQHLGQSHALILRFFVSLFTYPQAEQIWLLAKILSTFTSFLPCLIYHHQTLVCDTWPQVQDDSTVVTVGAVYTCTLLSNFKVFQPFMIYSTELIILYCLHGVKCIFSAGRNSSPTLSEGLLAERGYSKRSNTQAYIK